MIDVAFIPGAERTLLSANFLNHDHLHRLAGRTDALVNLRGVDALAAETHEEDAAEIGIHGEIEKRALDSLYIRPRLGAPLLMGERCRTRLTAKRFGDVVCADDGRKDSHQIAGSGQAVGTKIAAEFPPVGRKDRRGGGHAASIRGIGAILGL